MAWRVAKASRTFSVELGANSPVALGTPSAGSGAVVSGAAAVVPGAAVVAGTVAVADVPGPAASSGSGVVPQETARAARRQGAQAAVLPRPAHQLAVHPARHPGPRGQDPLPADHEEGCPG